MRKLTLILSVFISVFVLAGEPASKETLLKHYNIVRAHIDANKKSNQGIADSAKIAFDIAVELKEPNETIGTLGYYYLTSMGKRFNLSDKERVLVTLYEIDKNTEFQASSALNLVEYYIANRKLKKTNEIVDLLLTENKNDTKKLANINLQLGSFHLIHSGSNKKIFQASKKYIDKSIQLYSSIGDEQKHWALFWLGKYYTADGEYDKAISPFEEAIKSLEAQPKESKQLQVAESFLLKALIENGDEEKASNLCQKIGKVRPWDEGKEITPLYLLKPVYPRSALLDGVEASFRLKFIVDENGFAKNISVVTVKLFNSKRGSKLDIQKAFRKSALKALSQWRFAPRFENGQAVESVAYYILEFRMS